MAQAPHGDDGTRSGAGLRFFAGLDLVSPYAGAQPGISFTGRWGAVGPIAADSDGSRVLYCGVARCP